MLPSWAGARAPGVSLSLPSPWALASGPSRLFSNPISCPPAFAYGGCAQGLYHFLNRMRLPRVCSGLVWLGLSRHHMSCDNDDLSVFAPISSSSSYVPMILTPFCFSVSSGFPFLNIRSDLPCKVFSGVL